jgi:hypothetical protein
VRNILFMIVAACVLLAASCRSLTPAHATPGSATVAIGLLLHTTGPRLGPEARPEVAVLSPGQRVEWFSVDGELRITAGDSLPPAECQKRRRGHLCWMQIPAGQNPGRYRYRAVIRLEDGTEFPVDALLEVRR